jgi:hypothetical protein
MAHFAHISLLIVVEKSKQTEKKTVHPIAYLYMFAFLTFFIIPGGANFISEATRFLYPAMISIIKASDSGSGHEDNTPLLSYWIIACFCSIIESWAFFLIKNVKLYYFFLKMAFFVWLYHEKCLGAAVVYSRFIKPVIVPYFRLFISAPVEMPQFPTDTDHRLYGDKFHLTLRNISDPNDATESDAKVEPFASKQDSSTENKKKRKLDVPKSDRQLRERTV